MQHPTFSLFSSGSEYRAQHLAENLKKTCEEKAIKIAEQAVLALLRQKLRGRIVPQEKNMLAIISGGVELHEKKVSVSYFAGFFSVEIDVYPDLLERSAKINIRAVNILTINGKIFPEMHPGVFVGQIYTAEKNRE